MAMAEAKSCLNHLGKSQLEIHSSGCKLEDLMSRLFWTHRLFSEVMITTRSVNSTWGLKKSGINKFQQSRGGLEFVFPCMIGVACHPPGVVSLQKAGGHAQAVRRISSFVLETRGIQDEIDGSCRLESVNWIFVSRI